MKILKKARYKLSAVLNNVGGWTTNRKLVVIESDDWGSIRMPSKKVYNTFLEKGYKVNEIAYERYDSLASENDLRCLFDVLRQFKGCNRSFPVITANTIVANPDFNKIRESDFTGYYYEPFTETLARYPEHKRSIDLWKEGMSERLFLPQFHGREHLNVAMFMRDLNKGKKPDLRIFFDHGLAGCVPKHGICGGNNYVETLNFNGGEIEKQQIMQHLSEGLDLFYEIFGYRSRSMIPPNYIWHPDFESHVAGKGVRFIQGRRKMKVAGKKSRYSFHKQGAKNNHGQRHLVRNVFFEPTLQRNVINDPVGRALSEMAVAFRLRKPAIICTHRLNYIGYIDHCNRARNLELLESLFQRMLQEWPDIEFMTTVELGELMDRSDV